MQCSVESFAPHEGEANPSLDPTKCEGKSKARNEDAPQGCTSILDHPIAIEPVSKDIFDVVKVDNVAGSESSGASPTNVSSYHEIQCNEVVSTFQREAFRRISWTE